MSVATPQSPEELAHLLLEHASRKRPINLAGNRSKAAMGGISQCDATEVSTSGLRRILMYEPRDLTVSVEAGYPFSELQALLSKQGQMIALDPPFAGTATIGGVVATNGSGPMRRAFGTARDLVIGMEFATLEGKLIQAGGMVVKNVAGLDMGKLMIGSLGSLAAMTSINFRLHSIPQSTSTFLFTYPELADALEQRNAILKSVLQPLSLDLLSPACALRFSRRGHILALRAGGQPDVLRRYRLELSGAEELTGDDDQQFWSQIQEFASEFRERQPEGIVARTSTTLQGLAQIPKTVSGGFISRASSGVTYFYFPSWATALPWWKKMEESQTTGVIEFAPDDIRRDEKLWNVPKTGPARQSFVMMEKIKQMFDPNRLLNAGRLYGRI